MKILHRVLKKLNSQISLQQNILNWNAAKLESWVYKTADEIWIILLKFV